MKSQTYRADALRKLLVERKIATMPELKTALGTEVNLTVSRKLKELGYRSSYTHRGKYYTLNEVAAFDELGLWLIEGIGFSRFGSLVETTGVLVAESQGGYFAHELADVLNVDAREALLGLFRKNRIDRRRLSGRYLYVAADPATRKKQLHARRLQGADMSGSTPTDPVSDEVKAAIVLFFSLLDEKLRRLYAGLESLKLGRGGDGKMAGLLGLDVHTIARGRQELLANDVDAERIRKQGGGRIQVKKKRRT